MGEVSVVIQKRTGKAEHGGRENLLSVSEKATKQLETIPDSEQEKISNGIALVYSKVTSFLVNASLQSYISREHTHLQTYLTNHFQTFIISGYPVRVRICSDTYCWTIVSIEDPQAADQFNVTKIY